MAFRLSSETDEPHDLEATPMTAKQLRQSFSDAISRVAFGGERIVIERNKKRVAALVSVDDLCALELIEDYLDARDAERVLREDAGKPTVSLEELREELGL
ncbi:MAG TPA: type II toxin-antitoxin system Phd/YefM family antitoxin [Thermoleophilia bacterium]|nr:type II toxin-antitoxin system Phd/YefM family antitoxin [Thermoleophilia bacterium]